MATSAERGIRPARNAGRCQDDRGRREEGVVSLGDSQRVGFLENVLDIRPDFPPERLRRAINGSQILGETLVGGGSRFGSP